MTDTTIVQGDRETIAKTLERGGTSVDLTGRSVEFVLRHDQGQKVVDRPATITDAAAGAVEITLTSAETSRAGNHSAEYVITGGPDDPTTAPVKAPNQIYVRNDIRQNDEVFDGLLANPEVGTLTANALNGSLTGDVELSTIAGTNLSIVNGTLSATDTNTQIDPSTIGATDLGFDTATQTELDNGLSGKSDTAHGHPLSDVEQSSATAGQVPKWNGTEWAPSEDVDTDTQFYGSGEYVPLKSFKYPRNNYSSTATTYTNVIPGQERPLYDVDRLKTSNISSIFISVSCHLTNDTIGETSFLRLSSQPGTEVSSTGTAISGLIGPLEQSATQTGTASNTVEMKVSAGTAVAYTIDQTLWGEVV